MKNIEIDYWVNREENTIFYGNIVLQLSDRRIAEIADFIRDDHYSGELVDIPAKIYDKINSLLWDDIHKDLKREVNETLLEDDDVYLQSCLPASLLKVLPADVVEKIDKSAIYEYYETDSMEGVWKWLEENRETPEDVVQKTTSGNFMKCLAIRQPWAQMIVCGIKDIECRDAMPASLRKIFVAASGTKVRWNDLPTWVQEIYNEYEKKGVLPKYEDLPTKCIVGHVDIVKASFDPVDSIWGRDHVGMKYTLRNAMVLDELIYGKNKATPYFYNVEGYDENNLPPSHKVQL